jgi:hypothetical protein
MTRNASRTAGDRRSGRQRRGRIACECVNRFSTCIFFEEIGYGVFFGPRPAEKGSSIKCGPLLPTEVQVFRLHVEFDAVSNDFNGRTMSISTEP